jgi:hypothetical protein
MVAVPPPLRIVTAGGVNRGAHTAGVGEGVGLGEDCGVGVGVGVG